MCVKRRAIQYKWRLRIKFNHQSPYLKIRFILVIAHEAGTTTTAEEAVLREVSRFVQVTKWYRWVQTSDLFELRQSHQRTWKKKELVPGSGCGGAERAMGVTGKRKEWASL